MGVENNKMKTISSYLAMFAIFFMVTSGTVLLLVDIASKNDNLDESSQEMVSNLNTYQAAEAQHRFDANPTNYSLNGYETAEAFDKDNVESKGILSVFLFMSDAFFIIPSFMKIMLPWFPLYAFAWLQSILIAIAGYYFTLAVYNIWKGRKT